MAPLGSSSQDRAERRRVSGHLTKHVEEERDMELFERRG